MFHVHKIESRLLSHTSSSKKIHIEAFVPFQLLHVLWTLLSWWYRVYIIHIIRDCVHKNTIQTAIDNLNQYTTLARQDTTLNLDKCWMASLSAQWHAKSETVALNGLQGKWFNDVIMEKLCDNGFLCFPQSNLFNWIFSI